MAEIIGKIHKTFVRGDWCRFEFSITGLDLSASTMRIQLRTPPTQQSGVIQLSTGNKLVLDSATTGDIDIVYADGKTTFSWEIPDAATKRLLGQYMYDVEINSGGKPKTWVGGTMTFLADTTIIP